MHGIYIVVNKKAKPYISKKCLSTVCVTVVIPRASKPLGLFGTNRLLVQ